MGVGHAIDHLGNACLRQCPGAGPGAPLVIARLQGDIGRGPASPLAGIGQCIDFRMGLPGPTVEPLADDLAVAGDNATHPGIGPGRVQAPPGQLQGPGHAVDVEAAGHGQLLVSRALPALLSSLSSSARNSLISWKLRYTEAKRT